MDTPYVYVFVRADIPIEDQLCQLGHSCIEAGKRFQHPDNTYICVISSKNEDSLCKTAGLLTAQDIKFSMFYEPDDSIGYSSLATEPIYGSTREVFKKYKTWSYK